MTIDLKTYQRLKDKAESAQREADRAAGALEQIGERLKKEFGCSSVKDARKILQRTSAEEGQLEEECEAALAKLREDYPDLMER